MSKLSVYLVKGPISSYLDAIESIEDSQPLEKVKTFNLHIRGSASSSKEPNQVKLVRELGARPIIQTVSHGFYSVVKLQSHPISSIVATLQLSDNEEDLMICVLSECDIIAVDVDIDSNQEMFDESIPIQSKTAFPWVRVEDVLKS